MLADETARAATVAFVSDEDFSPLSRSTIEFFVVCSYYAFTIVVVVPTDGSRSTFGRKKLLEDRVAVAQKRSLTSVWESTS